MSFESQMPQTQQKTASTSKSSTIRDHVILLCPEKNERPTHCEKTLHWFRILTLIAASALMRLDEMLLYYRRSVQNHSQHCIINI